MHIVLAQVSDDFEDGDFTNAPTWSGNDALFLIDNGELRSNSPGAATYYLSTPSTLASNAEWQLFFDLEFATSGANFVDIYLMSDNPDLTAASDGMFVRIGGTSDKLVLYKKVAGANTELISSPDGIINSSSSNPFKLKVTRDLSDQWTLEYDDGNTGSFTSAGNVIDNDVITSSHFGIIITQSSAASPIGNHFFDDITVQEIGFDDTPPELLSLEVIADDQIRLTFSEEVEETSAENLDNYILSGPIIPVLASAGLSNANEVTLTYASAFENGSYSIQISDIEDLKGNVIVSTDQSFDVFLPDLPEFRDVIITEIMADPSPAVGLPDAEFIELFNNSEKTFDLAGWKLSDATSSASLSSFVFEPGARVIVSSNSNKALFEPFGNVVTVSSLPSLNNTGDQISLKYVDNLLIDSVAYSDDWYGDEDKAGGGYSLELIDINNVCGGQSNWVASISETGGTPGAINSVDDLSAGIELPTISSISVLDEQHLRVLMSEPMDSTSIDISNFQIDHGVVISNVRQNYDTLFVDLNSPLLPNSDYQLNIFAISDCTGNSVGFSNIMFKLFVNPEISYHDVIINEIMANPSEETTSPNVEYIELFNKSDKLINLKGWQFTDGSRTAILPDYFLNPSEFLVITSTVGVPLFDDITPKIGVNSFPTLNNSGDTLQLLTDNEIRVDSLKYSSSWYRSTTKDDGGYSLELIDPDNDCAGALNWIASEDDSGGTPGRLNSVLRQMPDNLGPRLESAYGLSSDSILLVFNEKLDESSIYNGEYSLSDNLVVQGIESSDLQNVYLILSDQTPLLSGKRYNINVDNLSDCPGNLIDSEFRRSDFFLVEEAFEGNVLINELLFNPRPNGVDFVELFNNSDKYISIRNWSVANGDLNNDSLTIKTSRVITSENLVLEPRSYKVLTADQLILKDQYPKGNETSFLQLANMPSFPNEEGLVALINSKGQIMDYFSYTEDLHADIINDPEGVSLERISVEESAQNPENWMSAAASENFATPGYANSQSRMINTAIDGEISIEPRVIIPDGSGQRDFTTINYSFSQTGNVANVRIFDVQGREIKRIASNDFLSNSGFYTWDGSDNNGQKAKIGSYIVLFEIFNANGDINTFKERVVIGSLF